MVKWTHCGITMEDASILSFAIYLQQQHIDVLKGVNSSVDDLVTKINTRINFLQSTTWGTIELTRFSYESVGHKNTIHGQIKVVIRSKAPDSDVKVMIRLRQTIRKYVVETTGARFRNRPRF